MNITDKNVDGVITLITLEGRLDANTTSALDTRFAELVDQGGRRFAWDLTGLEYVSSAGLRSLLLAAKKMKALQGKLTLFGMSSNVREVFDMSGFSAIFSVFDTASEAIAALQE